MIHDLLGKVNLGQGGGTSHYFEYHRQLAIFAVPLQVPGVYEPLLKLKQTEVEITNQHLYVVQYHLQCP